jgi:hypothetical protein
MKVGPEKFAPPPPEISGMCAPGGYGLYGTLQKKTLKYYRI